MPGLCHYTDLVVSVVMPLFLSHPDFAIHVFFLLSPMLWSPPLECVSYSGTAYISFDRNTALANLLCFFFLMLNCFLLFLQNNSIILSFPFLVISSSHGLPPVSEYHFLHISWSRKNTCTHKWSFSTIVIYPHHSIFFAKWSHSLNIWISDLIKKWWENVPSRPCAGCPE